MEILQYVLIGLLVGTIVGWIVGSLLLKRKITAEKRARQLRIKKRQGKILEHFRIEVKNNTIRLKKEVKRLALSKQLAPVELRFKNYNKRLYRVRDKDVLRMLQDFYKELISLGSVNEAYITFTAKNIQSNEKLEAETVEQIYISLAMATIQKIEKITETGPVIVGILEEKIAAS